MKPTSFQCVSVQHSSDNVPNDSPVIIPQETSVTTPIVTVFCGIMICTLLISGNGNWKVTSQEPISLKESIESRIGVSNSSSTDRLFFPSVPNGLPIIEYDAASKSVNLHTIEENASEDLGERGFFNMTICGIPLSFIIPGVIFGLLALLCTFAMKMEMFWIHPQYLLLLTVGFWGMTATVVAAIWEWRKKHGWKERERP